MAKRLTVTVSDATHDRLRLWAKSDGVTIRAYAEYILSAYWPAEDAEDEFPDVGPEEER